MTAETRTPRVVIADDDPDIRTLVAIAVRRAGLDLVGEAGDGDEAWSRISTLVPDLVILDVSMPGLSGLEVCRLVRDGEATSGILVLVLSAGVNAASRKAGLDAGATEYLTKPFSPRELAARLTELASRITMTP